MQWLEAAYRYRKAGFTPIPLQGSEKAKDPLCWVVERKWGVKRSELLTPYNSGWGESQLSFERFDEMFTIAGGIGIAVGPCSGGLAVLDFDDAEAHRIWLERYRKIARRLPAVKTFRGVHY